MPKKIRVKKPAMRKEVKPARAVDHFDTLRSLIGDYRDAAIAESWKGGGDPTEIPVFEAQLALAQSKLESHIQRMEREDFV